MQRIKDLTLTYHHSKESYTEQKRLVYVMKKELEKLEEEQSNVDDKLRVLAVKDEIKVSEELIEEREAELSDATAELLEALKEANIDVEETATFHLHDETYLDVRRTGDDSIIIFGPYSKNGG
ncbi:hypothetical protein [Pedobacter psychrodurus]|uniref:hypothetical protein n=1 Tax=Pedobacter psychrodurus TaxID=2530456 RepID=UPI00292EB3F9|nr:hypothetical protein [Pedobacter psychrodurus]